MYVRKVYWYVAMMLQEFLCLFYREENVLPHRLYTSYLLVHVDLKNDKCRDPLGYPD